MRVRITGGVAIKNSSPWIPPQSYQIKISGGGALASLLSSGSTDDSDTHHNCRTTVLATRLHLTGQDSDYPVADGADWQRLCSGGPGTGCCCLSDLLFLFTILCLLSTIWKQNKTQNQYTLKIMKVEKSEICTEEKSLILAPFQDNHY